MIQKIKFTITTIILGLIICSPVFAMGKANLTLSPASGEHQVGKTFNVSITANANEEAIDTVRAKVNFPKDKLEVVKFGFGELYAYPAGGNKYDNEAGTLNYGAGHQGGTTQSGVFGTITFKVKAVGKAVVTISSDSLMISSGEDKFTGKSFSASYNLIAPPPPPKKEEVKKEEPKKEEVKETDTEEEEISEEPADAPSLEEGTMADKENQDDIIIEPSAEETFEDETEEKDKETSDKTWMIITIILSVLFGLGGYYYGRSKSKSIRRRI